MAAEKVQKTVHSISEFIDEISKINATLIRNGANKNEMLLFRGHSDVTYELMPYIGRGRRSSCEITIFKKLLKIDCRMFSEMICFPWNYLHCCNITESPQDC